MKNFDLPARRLYNARTLVVCATVLLLVAGAPAQAAISPSTPSGANADAPANNAAVRQYVQDAQKALKEGNIRLTIILLKNALNAAPYREIMLTTSGHDFYRMEREADGKLEMIRVQEVA